MNQREQIDPELAKATKGLQEGNEGLTRTCARRGVTMGAQTRAERNGPPGWPEDAMLQLRRIQL